MVFLADPVYRVPIAGQGRFGRSRLEETGAARRRLSPHISESLTVQYEIHRDRGDGSIPSVQVIAADHVSEAYDLCVDALTRDPDVSVIHLHVGATRIHSVVRRG